MRKAYSKGISIISSCQNIAHLQVARRYIENFDVMYGDITFSRKLISLYNLLSIKIKAYE